MYYEERMIEGVMCWRSDPRAAFTAYTLEELAERYQRFKNEVSSSAHAGSTDSKWLASSTLGSCRGQS